MGEFEIHLLGTETGISVSVLVLHNAYGAPCDFGKEKSQVVPSPIRKAICYHEVPFVVIGSGGQGRFLGWHPTVGLEDGLHGHYRWIENEMLRQDVVA